MQLTVLVTAGVLSFGAAAHAGSKGPNPTGPSRSGLCKAYANVKGNGAPHKRDATSFKALTKAAADAAPRHRGLLQVREATQQDSELASRSGRPSEGPGVPTPFMTPGIRAMALRFTVIESGRSESRRSCPRRQG